MTEQSMVYLQQFIQATRDSGYKSLSSSIGELIDNSIEAGAKNVDIVFKSESELRVIVTDDGNGMDQETLARCLQFGWSSRFNRRDAMGRYGMGLPNSSLSQARRVEVYSWKKANKILWTVLDIDEILSSASQGIPQPRSLRAFRCPHGHGTRVVWSKCDRIADGLSKSTLQSLRQELGRIFRYKLWSGVRIRVNAEPVIPVDTLFLREGVYPNGAKQFGPILKYEVKLPGGDRHPAGTSMVWVKFSELPVAQWHGLTNDAKRERDISKGAGISILRAGREIDYGWFFVGAKRKENYDDWWRCEVHFESVLDEMFGVTHTKQQIHPGAQIKRILSPDIERIAHELNSRIRRSFAAIKAGARERKSEAIANRKDERLEPPKIVLKEEPENVDFRKAERLIRGLRYKIQYAEHDDPAFFRSFLQNDTVLLEMNKNHPFFSTTYGNSNKKQPSNLEILELLIMAFARAQAELKKKVRRASLELLIQRWSINLAGFLS